MSTIFKRNNPIKMMNDLKLLFRDAGIYINSSTDGQLNIVSDTTIALSGAVTITGSLTITGNMTFGDLSTDTLALTGQMNIGTSGSPVTLATAADRGLEIYTTCASTDGAVSVRPLFTQVTMTGVGGVGGRSEFYMTTNVALGGWSNALKGIVVYGASGKTTGLGSAVCAELTLSAGTTDGNYAPLEIELNMGASGVTGTATALTYMSVNDAAATTFDTSGYLFNIQGLTAGASNLFRTGLTAATINAATTAALRIKVGSTNYYIPIATATA